MKTTLEAMIVPTGGMPYRKTLQADENGSFLRALQDDPSRPVEPGELYHIAYGDMVCVGFDPETGEDRDITPEECQRVMERFGSVESIASGPIETCVLLAKAGRVVRL